MKGNVKGRSRDRPYLFLLESSLCSVYGCCGVIDLLCEDSDVSVDVLDRNWTHNFGKTDESRVKQMDKRKVYLAMIGQAIGIPVLEDVATSLP